MKQMQKVLAILLVLALCLAAGPFSLVASASLLPEGFEFPEPTEGSGFERVIVDADGNIVEPNDDDDDDETDATQDEGGSLVNPAWHVPGYDGELVKATAYPTSGSGVDMLIQNDGTQSSGNPRAVASVQTGEYARLVLEFENTLDTSVTLIAATDGTSGALQTSALSYGTGTTTKEIVVDLAGTPQFNGSTLVLGGSATADTEWGAIDFTVAMNDGQGSTMDIDVSLVGNASIRTTVDGSEASVYLLPGNKDSARLLSTSLIALDQYDNLDFIVVPAEGYRVDPTATVTLSPSSGSDIVTGTGTLFDSAPPSNLASTEVSKYTNKGAYVFSTSSPLGANSFTLSIDMEDLAAVAPHQFTSTDLAYIRNGEVVYLYYYGALPLGSGETIDINVAGDITGGVIPGGGNPTGVAATSNTITLDDTYTTGNDFEFTYTPALPSTPSTYTFKFIEAVSVEKTGNGTVTAEDLYGASTAKTSKSYHDDTVTIKIEPGKTGTVNNFSYNVNLNPAVSGSTAAFSAVPCDEDWNPDPNGHYVLVTFTGLAGGDEIVVNAQYSFASSSPSRSSSGGGSSSTSTVRPIVTGWPTNDRMAVGDSFTLTSTIAGSWNITGKGGLEITSSSGLLQNPATFTATEAGEVTVTLTTGSGNITRVITITGSGGSTPAEDSGSGSGTGATNDNPGTGDAGVGASLSVAAVSMLAALAISKKRK